VWKQPEQGWGKIFIIDLYMKNRV